MPRKKIHKLQFRKQSAYLIIFLLTPFAVYAVDTLLLFLMDTYMGDGMMLHLYAYVSRRQLVLQILSDGYRAIPLFYAASLLLWFEINLFSRYLNLRGFAPSSIAGALTGLALAIPFVGKSVGAVVPFALSGFLIASILGWGGQRAGFLKE